MSKELTPAERRKRMREHIGVDHVVRSAGLCEMLRVSEATVIRDLEWLEAHGVLTRTHGGAILSQRVRRQPQYAHQAQTHAEEKRRIGHAAAALVESGDAIFANGGTTTTRVVTYLPDEPGARVIINSVRGSSRRPETTDVSSV